MGVVVVPPSKCLFIGALVGKFMESTGKVAELRSMLEYIVKKALSSSVLVCAYVEDDVASAYMLVDSGADHLGAYLFLEHMYVPPGRHDITEALYNTLQQIAVRTGVYRVHLASERSTKAIQRAARMLDCRIQVEDVSSYITFSLPRLVQNLDGGVANENS